MASTNLAPASMAIQPIGSFVKTCRALIQAAGCCRWKVKLARHGGCGQIRAYSAARKVNGLSESTSLVAELDQRQNDVIRELDALNQRIEEVIKNWTDLRDED